MVKYKVFFAYFDEVVEMEEETTDYGLIVDKLIDSLEERGCDGCFVPYEETKESGNLDGCHEDEYITGGNHGLNLYHAGSFGIELMKEE